MRGRALPTAWTASAAVIATMALSACSPNGPAAAPPVPVSTFARPATTVAPVPTTPASTAPTATTTSAPTSPAATSPTSTSASTTPTTSTSTTTTTTTLPPAPPPPNSDFDRLELDRVLVADVDKPTGIAWRDGDDAMYISTQPGPVFRLLDGEITTVIDFTGRTFEDTPGSERGVLGIAFDPRDGRMFINYTDLADDTNIVSYELDDQGRAIADSRREVLFIDQPGLGHNGGRLIFDADGNLYTGSGDGGASNGWDAQDTTKLFGAILRIRPNLDGDGYEIPADNPFAPGSDGDGLDRPEVIARGFRNPWTFSIDDDTGDIWVGDVGNSTREEVSLLPQQPLGRQLRVAVVRRRRVPPQRRSRRRHPTGVRLGARRRCGGDGRLRVPRRRDPRTRGRVPVR